MTVEVLGPGHVLLRDRPARALGALLLGLPFTGTAAVGLARFGGLPLLYIGLGLSVLLLLTGVAGLLRRTELEITPDGVLLRRRGVLADRDRTAPRAAVRCVRLHTVATAAAGTTARRQPVFLVTVECRHPALPGSFPMAHDPRERRARRLAEALARQACLPLQDDAAPATSPR